MGWNIKVSPLFSDDYIKDLYNKNPLLLHIIKGYFNRLFYLLYVKHYDLIWIEKEVFPYLPAFVERILNKWGIPYVVDYDDATFHQYDCHQSWVIRKILSKKIAKGP